MELHVTIRLTEMVASNMMGEALVDRLKTINSCANSTHLLCDLDKPLTLSGTD